MGDARNRGAGCKNGTNRTAAAWYIINPSSSKEGVSGGCREAGRRRVGRREPHVPEPRRDHLGAGSPQLLAHGLEHVPELRIRGDRRSCRRQRRHHEDPGRQGATGRVHPAPADRRQPAALGRLRRLGGTRALFVYVAGEYIEQGPCTLQQYIATSFTCSGKRSSPANWSTAGSRSSSRRPRRPGGRQARMVPALSVWLPPRERGLESAWTGVPWNHGACVRRDPERRRPRAGVVGFGKDALHRTSVACSREGR